MKRFKIFISALMLLMLAVTPAVNADLTVTPKATGFADIQNHWGKDTITWGQGLGIALGFPDGTFKPDSTVTEAQFLAMLERTFTDTGDGDPWYQPYYDLAGQNNYPVGSDPDAVILRTQVAEIVAGTQGVNYTGDNAIQYLLGKGLAKGYDANIVSIPNYHGADTLTRAQAVQFIKNLKDAGIEEIKERPFDPSPISELPELPVTEEPAQPGQPEFIGKIAVPDNPNLKINQYNAVLPLTLYDGTIIKSITLGKDGKYDAVIVKADRSKSNSDAFLSIYFGKKRLSPVGNADTNSIWWQVAGGYEAYLPIYDNLDNHAYLDVSVTDPDTIGIRSGEIYWVPNPLK